MTATGLGVPTGVIAIADAVRTGRVSAVAVARDCLARIAALDPPINAVTRILASRAVAEAAAVDEKRAAGIDPGPLAGVPYGVKDLFDVTGEPTTAGAGMRRDAPAATSDAEAIRRLGSAGAVMVATLNMDEYAYGFATDNAAWGITRNPHDVARLAGGSSGGSAAAVAGGLLPFTLGSDTNGSIRVPASLCGVYGLKPTHGALPMGGVFPFVESFDDIGPFAATLEDLAAVHAVLAGGRPRTPDRAPRAALLGGWFVRDACADLAAALRDVGEALSDAATVELAEVERARSAAFLMTAAEGGARHLPELRRRVLAFDPATRDRLIAGAALPSAAYLDAVAFRGWFRARCLAMFERYDVLIAPATSDVAPSIDDPIVIVNGQAVPARANLGMLTQPISFVGLPALAAPVLRPGRLPLGIQLIAAPGGEAALFAIARRLEEAGLVGASPAAGIPARAAEP